MISQQHITFNFGKNILNTHNNVADSDDLIIVCIEAYISTDSTTGLENQTITFHGEILEFPSAMDTVELELVHPQLQVCRVTLDRTLGYLRCSLYTQLNNFSVEPSGPWDGGDNIVLSISFSHIMVGQKLVF